MSFNSRGWSIKRGLFCWWLEPVWVFHHTLFPCNQWCNIHLPVLIWAEGNISISTPEGEKKNQHVAAKKMAHKKSHCFQTAPGCHIMCCSETQDRLHCNPGQSRCAILFGVGTVILQQKPMTPAKSKHRPVCRKDVFTDESQEFHPVSSQDINLRSWTLHGQFTAPANAIRSLLVLIRFDFETESSSSWPWQYLNICQKVWKKAASCAD